MYSFYTSGVWSGDLAPFYSRAATAGVAVFFMITGFLFWLRLLRAGAGFDFRASSSRASGVSRRCTSWAGSDGAAVIFSVSAFALRALPTQLVRELQAWLSFGSIHTGPCRRAGGAFGERGVLDARLRVGVLPRAALSRLCARRLERCPVRRSRVLLHARTGGAQLRVRSARRQPRAPQAPRSEVTLARAALLAALAVYFMADGYVHKMVEGALLRLRLRGARP